MSCANPYKIHPEIAFESMSTIFSERMQEVNQKIEEHGTILIQEISFIKIKESKHSSRSNWGLLRKFG